MLTCIACGALCVEFPADGSVLCSKDLAAVGLKPACANETHGGLVCWFPDSSAVLELQHGKRADDNSAYSLEFSSTASCTDLQLRPDVQQIWKAVCGEDVGTAAAVGLRGQRISQYPELLHLTDAAGFSLPMLCCIELGALAKKEKDTSGVFKLLDAGERQG
jgi:hypothetical protein